MDKLKVTFAATTWTGTSPPDPIVLFAPEELMRIFVRSMEEYDRIKEKEGERT